MRAKLGNLECTIANLSNTGAMLRSRLEVAVGREVQLLIELPQPVSVKVRVVRCEPVDVALPGEAVWRRQDFALGVHFIDTTTDLTSAIRALTHARYAVSTAKRIGAKAVVVNFEIDPQFSARNVLDTLRADPATATLPIILCARQAWLQQTHKSYINDKRLRLLLVPFTPEELIATVDRSIDEQS